MKLVAHVELELTNYCNARCVSCPREGLPTLGMISENSVSSILDLYEDYTSPQTGLKPSIILAGGGDPLLHPRLPEIVEDIQRRGFQTVLISNLARGRAVNMHRIIDAVDEVRVSFWGIERVEYEAAMKLRYDTALESTLSWASAAEERNKKFVVQWLRTEHLRSSGAEIREFWEARGIRYVEGGDVSWDRAGALKGNSGDLDRSQAIAPNFERKNWCADFALTDCYSWTGSLVSCCCAFFHSKFGVLSKRTPLEQSEVASAKQAFERSAPSLKECSMCKLPRAIRGSQILSYVNGVSSVEPSDYDY